MKLTPRLFHNQENEMAYFKISEKNAILPSLHASVMFICLEFTFT